MNTMRLKINSSGETLLKYLFENQKKEEKETEMEKNIKMANTAPQLVYPSNADLGQG